MRKNSIKIVLSIMGILVFSYYITNVFAQCTTPTSKTSRATGLVSTPSLSGKFGTIGGCVIDPKLAAFVLAGIPTYLGLESSYFDQAKDDPSLLVNKNSPITGTESSTESFTQFNIPMGTTEKAEDQLYFVDGDLNLTSEPTGTRTGVVFVRGTLTIGPILDDNQFNFGSNTSGIVFIVQGDVNILTSMTQVDAVIISSGTICTAYDASTSSCPTGNVTADPLIINGSLISLTGSAPIKFRRSLKGTGNNITAAEIINHQVKYLVILRNLISDTHQIWSEITSP